MRLLGSRTRTRTKKSRRRFSLNGLAIQLAAFALSFTLVALLVVAGSQAAFVEENESVTNYVPIGAQADEADPPAPRPARATAGPLPTTAPPVPPPAEEPVEEPVDEPADVPAEVPVAAVELTDSDAGSAMFTDGTTLAPGTTHDRCIEVTYTGSTTPLPVVMYAAEVSGDLGPYLDLAIDMGRSATGGFGDCADFSPSETLYEGTLADFATTHPGYESGRTTWSPTEGEQTRSFRFRVAVQDDPAAAGRSTSFGFSWRTGAP